MFYKTILYLILRTASKGIVLNTTYIKPKIEMKYAIVALTAFFLVQNVSVYGLLPGDNQTVLDDTLVQDNQQLSKVKTVEKNQWTIGIYTGSSPFQLSPAPNVVNPVLTAADVSDLNVDIVAHPFMIVTDSLYYMFFTAKDEKTDKGGIGMAESKDGINWKYKQIVIKEPFVLAYPYVFKWQNDYYMIPEAHTETSVRLYKAIEFPAKWKYEGDLLTGEQFFVPTVIRYKEMWWMFIVRPGNETLRLFYADDLKGPWTEHPQSPIVKNDLNTARPAGRPFIIDGILYRLGMDCDPTYGSLVHAFKITDLSTKIYAEKIIDIPLVKFSSKGWNAEAMHHVDAHQLAKNKWIAVVDALGK
jgi:hypothetical protein